MIRFRSPIHVVQGRSHFNGFRILVRVRVKGLGETDGTYIHGLGFIGFGVISTYGKHADGKQHQGC